MALGVVPLDSCERDRWVGSLMFWEFDPWGEIRKILLAPTTDPNHREKPER